jgi:hypothetical protein
VAVRATQTNKASVIFQAGVGAIGWRDAWFKRSSARMTSSGKR